MRESKLTKWREILENAWKTLGKEVWSEREWFGRWTGSDRSRKWELDHDNPIYRASVILDRLKCWEVSSHLSRKVSRKTTLTDAAIEEVLRNEAKTLEEKLDWSSSYRGPRNFLNRSTSYQGSVEIAIRKKLGSSIDSQVSRRCRASFYKQFFEEEKNTDMNAIKHATHTMIESTF